MTLEVLHELVRVSLRAAGVEAQSLPEPLRVPRPSDVPEAVSSSEVSLEEWHDFFGR